MIEFCPGAYSQLLMLMVGASLVLIAKNIIENVYRFSRTCVPKMESL